MSKPFFGWDAKGIKVKSLKKFCEVGNARMGSAREKRSVWIQLWCRKSLRIYFHQSLWNVEYMCVCAERQGKCWLEVMWCVCLSWAPYIEGGGSGGGWEYVRHRYFEHSVVSAIQIVLIKDKKVEIERALCTAWASDNDVGLCSCDWDLWHTYINKHYLRRAWFTTFGRRMTKKGLRSVELPRN